MSDDIKSTDNPVESPEKSELVNLKAEMNRKLEAQNVQLAQLLAELKSSKAPAPVSTESKRPSVFEDEDAYARSIEDRATARVKAEMSAREAQQSRVQQTIQSIISEYPEVSDESSSLMVRAKELFAGLGEDEKQSPLAMKMAVTSAASELGLKPKSKRSGDSESFTLSSNGSRNSGNRANNTGLDSKTEEFARIMGLDTSKKEVRERLKSKSNRDYNRYSE